MRGLQLTDITLSLASIYLRGSRDAEAVLRREPLLFSPLCEDASFLGRDSTWAELAEALQTLPSDGDDVSFGRAVLTAGGRAEKKDDHESLYGDSSYRRHSRSNSDKSSAVLSAAAGFPEAILQFRLGSIRALTSVSLRRSLASDTFLYTSCYSPWAASGKKVHHVRSTLFRTLRERIIQFSEKQERGEILPVFSLIENPSTGLADVDFEPVKAEDASLAKSLRSLERILCKAFLDYPGAAPADNFLEVAFPEGAAGTDDCRSALDFVSRRFTLLSLERFEYALWIVSGCAQAEVAAALSSIADQLDSHQRGKRERPLVESFGHVRRVKASPIECVDEQEHYEAVVGSAWECLVGPQWPEGQERPSFAHTFDSKKDGDALSSAFEGAIGSGDLFSAVSFLDRWIELGYAAGKAVAVGVIREIQRAVESDRWFIFERDSVLRGGGINRVGETQDPAKSLTTLFRAACRCLGINCQRPENMLLGTTSSSTRDGCRLLWRTYSTLCNVPDLQMHTDFRAGVHQVEGYPGSELEAFCEGRSALADFTKVLLHRRYGELRLMLNLMSGLDYAVLCEHVGGLLSALGDCGESETGYPEPIVEIRDHKPYLLLSDEERVSFPQFQQLLAMQFYGILTTRLLANDISLAQGEALVTNSSIDQLLTRLWNRECRSVEEIMAALDEFRVNLLQYLLNYVERQPDAESLLSLDEVAVRTSPIRDRAIIAKLNPTILVVDDEAMMLDLLRKTFELVGFSVYVARDGEEGLEVFRKHIGAISVVVTDQMMGRMNGDEMASHIREMSDVPIVMCSGASMSQLRDSPLIDAFISKPAGMAELTDTILDILAKYDPATYGQAAVER